jgi:hypothetical protein
MNSKPIKKKVLVSVGSFAILVSALTILFINPQTDVRPDAQAVVTNAEQKQKSESDNYKKQNFVPENEIPARSEEETVLADENPAEEAEIISEKPTEDAEAALEPLVIDIAQTKSLFSNQASLPESGQTGKIYLQNKNGKLESVVKSEKEGFYERLISYDAKGNTLDELEIGTIDGAGKTVKRAVISGNRISVFEIVSAKGGKKQEETVTEYRITPQLTFRKGKTYTRLK